MKKTCVVLSIVLVVLMSVLTIGCGKHAEVPPGKEGVNEKTAGYRTAGGGIEEKPFMPGKPYSIGDSWSDSDMKLLDGTPFAVVKIQKVKMPQWNNLEMDFKATLIVCLVPGTGYRVLSDMGSNWKQILFDKPWESTIQEVFSEQSPETLKDRDEIASTLLLRMRSQIKNRGQTEAECIMIMDATVNNLDYPPKILLSKAKTAIEIYDKQLTEISNLIKEEVGQRRQTEAETINLAYKIEQGSTNPAYLAQQSLDIVEAAMMANSELWFIVKTGDNGLPEYVIKGK